MADVMAQEQQHELAELRAHVARAERSIEAMQRKGYEPSAAYWARMDRVYARIAQLERKS